MCTVCARLSQRHRGCWFKSDLRQRISDFLCLTILARIGCQSAVDGLGLFGVCKFRSFNQPYGVVIYLGITRGRVALLTSRLYFGKRLCFLLTVQYWHDVYAAVTICLYLKKNFWLIKGF